MQNLLTLVMYSGTSRVRMMPLSPLGRQYLQGSTGSTQHQISYSVTSSYQKIVERKGKMSMLN